jgi:hypothetical protein
MCPFFGTEIPCVMCASSVRVTRLLYQVPVLEIHPQLALAIIKRLLGLFLLLFFSEFQQRPKPGTEPVNRLWSVHRGGENAPRMPGMFRMRKTQ